MNLSKLTLEEKAVLIEGIGATLFNNYLKVFKAFVSLLDKVVKLAVSFGIFKIMYTSSKSYFIFLKNMKILSGVLSKIPAIIAKSGFYGFKVANSVLNTVTNYIGSFAGSEDLATKIGIKLTNITGKATGILGKTAAELSKKSPEFAAKMFAKSKALAAKKAAIVGGKTASSLVPTFLKNIAYKFGHLIGSIAVKITPLLKTMLITKVGLSTAAATAIVPVVIGVGGIASFLILYSLLKMIVKYIIKSVKLPKEKAQSEAIVIAKKSLQLQKQMIQKSNAPAEKKAKALNRIKKKQQLIGG